MRSFQKSPRKWKLRFVRAKAPLKANVIVNHDLGQAEHLLPPVRADVVRRGGVITQRADFPFCIHDTAIVWRQLGFRCFAHKRLLLFGFHQTILLLVERRSKPGFRVNSEGGSPSVESGLIFHPSGPSYRFTSPQMRCSRLSERRRIVLLLQIVRRADKADGLALRPHQDRMRDRVGPCDFTPRKSALSLMPVAQKMMFFPFARSSAKKTRPRSFS